MYAILDKSCIGASSNLRALKLFLPSFFNHHLRRQRGRPVEQSFSGEEVRRFSSHPAAAAAALCIYVCCLYKTAYLLQLHPTSSAAAKL